VVPQRTTDQPSRQNPAKMSRFRIDASGAFPLYPPLPARASFVRAHEFLAVTMFAVIKTGGKQYRVAKDDVIVVEKLDGKAGSKITFKDVLMSGDGKTVKLGKDVAGVTVSGTLVETKKGDKVTVFKKRRRNTYRRKIGHRQTESHVKITAIGAAKKEDKE
jgi:large subunit ribosomal protein L21